MKKSALRHLSDYLPQLRSLHALLCKAKHHPGVYYGTSLVRQAVLEFGGPDGALLFLSNATNNLAGFLREGREGLPKSVIWRL